MASFPFYRYPYPYYYRNQRLPNTYNINPEYKIHNDIENQHISDDSRKTKDEKCEVKNQVQADRQKTSRYNSFGPIHFQNPLSVDSEEPVLEILGIKLYLDDIIILSLLFFLYKEGVKDEMLFLSLILLLLS